MIRSIAWIAATCIGLFVGGFVLHFPGSFGELRSLDMGALIFGGILGFITGVTVGLVQWLALLLPRHAGGRLLGAMGIGIGVTHAVNDGAPAGIGLLAVSIMSGLGMLAAFAGPLEERRPVVLATCFGAWLAGLVVADAVTTALGMPFSQTPVGWSMEHAVNGLVVGLVWGVATAVVGLPTILDRRRAESDPEPEAITAGG